MWHEYLRSVCVLSQYIFIQALRSVGTKAENQFSGLGRPNVILEELAMLKNPYQLTKNLNVDEMHNCQFFLVSIAILKSLLA